MTKSSLLSSLLNYFFLNYCFSYSYYYFHHIIIIMIKSSFLFGSRQGSFLENVLSKRLQTDQKGRKENQKCRLPRNYWKRPSSFAISTVNFPVSKTKGTFQIITDTADGSEIPLSPVEVGSWSHYILSFFHPRWFSRRISEPSTAAGNSRSFPKPGNLLPRVKLAAPEPLWL